MYIDILETETGKQVYEDGKAEEARKTIIDVLKLRFEEIPEIVVSNIKDGLDLRFGHYFINLKI